MSRMRERAFALLDDIEAEEMIFLETNYEPEPLTNHSRCDSVPAEVNLQPFEESAKDEQ